MNRTSSPSEGLAALKKIIREQGELLLYELGQPLCESRFIPGQVLLIESGSARLLGEQGTRLSTLTKLEAGQLVGAASLLRGAPCEDVRAASELVALRISDEDFLDLVRHNSDVSADCRKHVWAAELAALLTSLLDKAPKQTRSLSSWLDELLPQAHLLDPTDNDAIQSAFKAKRRFFVGGQPGEDSDAALGEELTTMEEISTLPTDIHQLPLRLISLPDAAIQELNQETPAELVVAEVVGNTAQDDSSNEDIPKAPLRPPVSRFNSNKAEDRDFFVGGEGPLQETLACFQMLAKLMKLPFRRDAIEKVLRDQL